MTRLMRLVSAWAAAFITLSAGAAMADGPARGAGTITGRVVDVEGKPVKGAHVIAVEIVAPPPNKNGMKKPPKMLASTDTLADGTYKLDPVPAGNVRVAARMEGTADHAYHYAALRVIPVVAGHTTKIDDIKLVPHGVPGGSSGSGPGGGSSGG